jgi:hypothetical protein
MKTTIDKAPKCLNTNDKTMWVLGWNEAVDALKEALAQPEQPVQEPVAWFNRPEVLAINETEDWNDDSQRIVDKAKQDEIAELRLLVAAAQPLYTSPPKREWVGLTHEEHMEIMTSNRTTSSRIAAVEAKLKELNHEV